jgi:hypothetical protein
MRHVHDAQIRRGELGSSISISDSDGWCGEQRDNQPMRCPQGVGGGGGGGKVAFSSLLVRYLDAAKGKSCMAFCREQYKHQPKPRRTQIDKRRTYARTHTQNPRQSSITPYVKKKSERAQRTKDSCPSHHARLSIRPRRASPSSSAAPSRRPRRSLPTAHSSSRFVSTRAASRRT